MASTILLSKVPEDIYEYLLKQQAKIKIEKKKGVFGIEQTIYSIIRDCRKCDEDEKKTA